MANRQLNGNVHGVVVKMNTARRRLDGKRRRRDEKREVEWRVTILYTYIYITIDTCIYLYGCTYICILFIMYIMYI